MDAFYVVGREQGFEPEPLPLWTDRPGAVNPFDAHDAGAVTRADLADVPGGFQLLNVLSSDEADRIVEIVDGLGFHEDSPVSLPHSVRHNQNLNWVVSEAIDSVIWDRSKALVGERIDGERAKGLNARFRFYRYRAGDFFKPHTDGAWPGSRVIDGALVQDATPGWVSWYTYLIFLNDGYVGGRTQFFVSSSDPGQPARRDDDLSVVSVATPKGGILCFPHGHHPLHCLHASEPVASGVKTIIRTDILF